VRAGTTSLLRERVLLRCPSRPSRVFFSPSLREAYSSLSRAKNLPPILIFDLMPFSKSIVFISLPSCALWLVPIEASGGWHVGPVFPSFFVGPYKPYSLFRLVV